MKLHTGRLVMGTLLAGLLSASTPALATHERQGGASASAYQAGDAAVFTRIGDWWATLGKSGLEKDAILFQRRTARVARRAGRAIEDQAQHAEQGLREAGEGLEQGMRTITGQ